MKKYIMNLAFILLSIIVFSACDNEVINVNDPQQGGIPVVRYVRPCNVDVSDSLLASAYLGNRIAIIGENLAGVTSIYFNDVKALLNPNFVTDNTIIVNVPSDIPGIKQDLIKLYTKNDSSYYTFETKVPAPSVTSLTCEYIPDGGIVNIQGSYFINDGATPLKVTFTGGLDAEIVSYDLKNIAVKVPTGAQPGPITVTSVYGSEESSLWFRDNRNIIANFNPNNYPDYLYFFGWHGAGGVSDVNGINGYYLIINKGQKELTDKSWDDGILSWEKWTYLISDPDYFDATKIDNYVCKFEVKVLGDWSSKALQVIFTGASDVMLNWQNGNGLTHNSKYTDANGYIKDTDYPRALWQPWATAKDKTYSADDWITVTIPMSDFVYGPQGTKLSAPNGSGHYSGLTLFLYGGGVTGTPCNPTFYIDNVRIVKK